MKVPEIIENNKHVFATYLVMALNNAHNVLDHIGKIANIDTSFDYNKDEIWNHPVVNYLRCAANITRKDNVNIPDKKANADTTRLITEKIAEYFPFAPIVAEIQKDYRNKRTDKGSSTTKKKQAEVTPLEYFEVLNYLFRVLKAYRDTTEHLIFIDKRWNDGSPLLKYNEQPLAKMINNYFGVALRNIKERFNYSTEQLSFIQDFRYKKIRVAGEHFPRTELDTSFFLTMNSPNGAADGTMHLSWQGIMLIICLLIERRYVSIFMSKLPKIYGKYSAESEERRIIRRAFSINGILLPNERIRSDKNEMAIALDMLNELKRCPRELFGQLSQPDQERFRLSSKDFNEVLMVRSSDRFAQLTLQYIDYNKLFHSIRFQTNMGKLRYLLNADKHCIDGEHRIRTIEHPINAFGRIQELEANRRNNNGNFYNSNIPIRGFDDVKRDDANPDNYPYIVDTYTKYIIENNKIFLSKGNLMPDIEECDGKWYVTKYIPWCSISVFELPAMAMHMHLLGPDATEKAIEDTIGRYEKLFKAMADGVLTKENVNSFGIAEADMPKKVIDYISGNTAVPSFRSHVLKEIDVMATETTKLLDNLKNSLQAIGSSANKMGKRGFKTIQTGKLADFLAHDIVKFQRSGNSGDDFGTDRMTGLNFRLMQSAIATFNDNTPGNTFTELKELFHKAGLTEKNGKNAHPFLFRATNRHAANAVDFYGNYLRERLKYLSQLKSDLETDFINNESKITFANHNRMRWTKRDSTFYTELGKTYLENCPIELPRQLFDNDIKKTLKKMPSMQDVDFENANVTYLIAEYLHRERNDDFQQFYSYKRNYRYIDMLFGQYDAKNALTEHYSTTDEREKLLNERIERTKDYIEHTTASLAKKREYSHYKMDELAEIASSRAKRSFNDFNKNERAIRRMKVQDALLMFMASDTLTKFANFDGKKFLLSEIAPDNDRGILSVIMPMDFRFIINGRSLTIHAENIKLKNYGDLFALVNDKRLSSLLNMVDETTIIDKDKLEKEFDNYDDLRPQVVKLVIDLEKSIYNNFPEIKKLAEYDDEKRFDFKLLMQELVNAKIVNNNDRNTINLIRNAFSHNSYPDKLSIEIKALPEIAKYIVGLFKEKTDIDMTK